VSFWFYQNVIIIIIYYKLYKIFYLNRLIVVLIELNEIVIYKKFNNNWKTMLYKLN
jgi:hypothetical protein